MVLMTKWHRATVLVGNSYDDPITTIGDFSRSKDHAGERTDGAESWIRRISASSDDSVFPGEGDGLGAALAT